MSFNPRFGPFGRLFQRQEVDEPTVVTIDDIVLKGVTRVDEVGGWDAPEKRAENGFSYDSYVGTDPIEASIDAWVDDEEYRRLDSLRDSTEPFPASIDHVNLSSAKLDNLTVERQGSVKSHRQVTIEITEIVEAEIAEAELWLDTPSGEMGTSAAASDPYTAYSQDDDTGTGDDASGSGGIVGALSDVREGLSGIL